MSVRAAAVSFPAIVASESSFGFLLEGSGSGRVFLHSPRMGMLVTAHDLS